MKHVTPSPRAALAAVLTCTVLAATGPTGSASAAGPAGAGAGPDGLVQVRAVCLAGGGSFHLGRFDAWRCQDADMDGMGVFWAERSVCEHVAHRAFAEFLDPVTGRGTWVCLPTAG